MPSDDCSCAMLLLIAHLLWYAVLCFAFRRSGRRGMGAADGAMALTDSPTKYYLRQHAQHLKTIGVDQAEVSQGRASGSSSDGGGPVSLHAQLMQIGPRPGEARAMPLGSAAGFDLVAQYFSRSVFQQGSAE